ncbi:class I SAM-dependent methyltransferase [uncultured Dokdonia sp.]|uniref:class I SAM-dependent methyltransferase n=1 Tax=uncultured Dokdonia sp. TaxID=575653 RepID=UPI0026142AA7|nr:class I SAM-dependent methyltransferase [uncultured Dokdonia sp.]
MLHQILTYLKWLPKTFHLHGIHSPFVFSFEKECLKDTPNQNIYHLLLKYRNTLLKNDQIISVTDYGAGSRVFSSNKRPVKKIARYAGASIKRMQLIYSITNYFSSKNILEIGTSLGMGTIALALNSNSKVISLEGCPATAQIAKTQLQHFNINNVNIIIGEFRESIKKQHSKQFDLVYFDGNHSKEATLQYAQDLLPTITNETIWVFDDIHWSSEMTKAWNLIKDFSEVTVTIDCFWVGFVFFRKEQHKEHFAIKL